jgi:hypothetical protein
MRALPFNVREVRTFGRNTPLLRRETPAWWTYMDSGAETKRWTPSFGARAFQM